MKRRHKDQLAVAIWLAFAVLLVLALRDVGVIPWAF